MKFSSWDGILEWGEEETKCLLMPLSAGEIAADQAVGFGKTLQFTY